MTDSNERSGVSNYYVSAGADSAGDGSEGRPFASLARAEAVSKAEDVIYVVTESPTVN